MPGPSPALSTLDPLDWELLALTMSTHATPMFTLTDSAFRPEISALDRAGSLKMQTHQECPPGPLTPLEYALMKNAPATPLECALTKKGGGEGGLTQVQTGRMPDRLDREQT